MRPPPPDWERGEPRGRHGGPPDGFPMGLREVKLSPATAALFEMEGPSQFYFAIWSRGGRLIASSTNAPSVLAIPARESAGTTRHIRSREEFRESFQFNQLGECFLVGRDLTRDLSDINRFKWWLFAAGGSILALGLGGGWWLVDHSIRPVQQMITAATRISAGNLSERIKEEDTENELGRLASVLNSTFARLEAAFGQQKQFTADAAHELRTPIAVLISEAQATLARERTSAEYRETLEACLATAQQMRKLTESLLDLARFDTGQTSLKMQETDLAEISAESLQMVQPLARGKSIKLSCDLGEAACKGDGQRLQQVVTNLLVNAIAYNTPGGSVNVRTFSEQNQAVVEVSDTGCGIPEADLPHIFKRFFRSDPSRNRTEGHSGLGLAIVKAILDLHLAAIEVTSEPGKGSTFRVRIPTAPRGA